MRRRIDVPCAPLRRREASFARVALWLLACGVVGCEGPQSALQPGGPQARRLHDLTVVLTTVCGGVFVVVVGLLVAAVLLKKPGPPREEASSGERRKMRTVLVGAVLTAVTLIALFVESMRAARAISAPADGALVVKVAARQWWWEITYPGGAPNQLIRTANELHVPVGRPVEIVLESRDVIHSFWVPGLQGKMDAIPGRATKLTLQADRPGVYRGQCAEFCGLQHAKMAFFVVAEPQDAFERWAEAQRAPAREPADEIAQRGRAVFERACAACHAVRGSEAFAAAGPDLTHLASRLSLGAGTLPNGRGALGGWIVDPQHAKPGSFMPGMDVEPEALHALLRYLEGLR